MPISTKNKKEEARSHLLRQRGLPKNTRAIVLAYIQDPKILDFFCMACRAIGVELITDVDEAALSGGDIWITDTLDGAVPVTLLCERGIIPVIPAVHPYASVFEEFDPMKFEGNAFIFDTPNQFQMFEKLIRAIENTRYAGDKRILLRNVGATKIS